MNRLPILPARLMFLLSCLVLGASFYLQYVQSLEPCPLCLMQRFMVMILLLLSLAVLLSKTQKMRRRCLSFCIFFSIAGLFFVGRQIWLQNYAANESVACLPGITIIWKYLPFKTLVNAFFWGTVDCAEASWNLLGLSSPVWAGCYFFTMLAISSYYLFFSK